MQYDAELIEYIVREVIRRLRASDSAAPAPAALAPPTRELVLADRLVTLETVRGKLDGILRVVVRRRAVVTPAVRDELRQRRITLSVDY